MSRQSKASLVVLLGVLALGVRLAAQVPKGDYPDVTIWYVPVPSVGSSRAIRPSGGQKLVPSKIACGQTTSGSLGDMHTLYWLDPLEPSKFCVTDISIDLTALPIGEWYIAVSFNLPPGTYQPCPVAPCVLKTMDGRPYPVYLFPGRTAQFTVAFHLPLLTNVKLRLNAE